MNVQQAQKELADAKIKARELRKRMEALRSFLLSKGLDPDPRTDRSEYFERKKKIHIAFKEGESKAKIAGRFQLSSGRVSSICKRIDGVLDKPGNIETYNIYKSVAAYRALTSEIIR